MDNQIDRWEHQTLAAHLEEEYDNDDEPEQELDDDEECNDREPDDYDTTDIYFDGS